MIVNKRYLMEEEEEPKEDKKEEAAPSFLNKKMEHLFFEKTANSAEPATLNQLIKGARACHCCLLPRLA